MTALAFAAACLVAGWLGYHLGRWEERRERIADTRASIHCVDGMLADARARLRESSPRGRVAP